MQRFNILTIQRFFLILSLVALAGCAGYRLGPTNGDMAGEKTVRVAVFKNQTREPRLIEPMTQALRKQLQQDGTYRLCTAGEPDIVVEGVILSYNRQELSLKPSDAITVQDYTISITAKIIATAQPSGKVLLDREVKGQTTIQVGNDLTSGERQAAPLLAEDLARNVVSLLVDGDW